MSLGGCSRSDTHRRPNLRMATSPEPHPVDRPRVGGQRLALALLLFVTPVVSAPLALMAPIVGVAVAALVAPKVWPGITTGRAILVGIVAVVAGIVGLAGAVIWTYGLCVPTGNIALVPPAIGLAAYAGVYYVSLRLMNPWLWPVSILIGAVTWGALGLALEASGVTFSC